MPYDAVKDFRAGVAGGGHANVLVTNPQALPAADIAGIIATAKASGKVSCASGSNGSAGHLACELFKLATGAQ